MAKNVHIYPIPGVSIPGVPAIEQEVTADEWADLKRYVPPAFTTHPPEEEPASTDTTEDTV